MCLLTLVARGFQCRKPKNRRQRDSLPGSSVHAISQTILEWVAIPFSRDRTYVSCIGRRILYRHQRSPKPQLLLEIRLAEGPIPQLVAPPRLRPTQSCLCIFPPSVCPTLSPLRQGWPVVAPPRSAPPSLRFVPGPLAPPLPACAAPAPAVFGCGSLGKVVGSPVRAEFFHFYHVERTAGPPQVVRLRSGGATVPPAGAGGRCGWAREHGRMGLWRSGMGQRDEPLGCGFSSHAQPAPFPSALRKARREQQLVSKRLLRDEATEEAEGGCVVVILGEAEVSGQDA